ncbi:MAG: hypothetical protein AB8G99_27035, partial [Planctomycetaceae bacterium]
MHNLLRSLQKRIHGSQSSTLKNLRPVRRARRRPRQSLEALEDRALLAAVLWDGGGDGSSWGDADNWDTNAVPTIGDDVTIANAEVSVSESLLVRTLTTTDTTLNFSGGYSIGADDVEIGVGSAINAGSNSFQIHGRYNGRSINIGAWEVLAWQMNLTEAELNRVDTPHLTIGDDNDGWIPVRTTAADETISLNTHLTLRNSGTISFYDSLELNGNDLTAVSHSDEHQVDVWGNALTNVGGDISLESARRIRVGANGRIQTSTGDITLSANVAGDGQGEFNGVSIEGQVRTIGTGSITIEGRGGNAADKEHQLGVTIFGFGIVESTAATNGGKIDITGWGGGGTNVNVGVDVGSKIIGQSGPISIAGYGGGTGSNNMGVSLYSNARVESLSRTATVDVVGFGAGWTSDGSVAATANGENNGIQISGAAQITSTGVVTVVGYGAGSGDDNNGVHLTNGQISSVEQTNITGFGAGWDPDHQLANNAGSLNDGIRIENSSRVGGSGGLTLEGTGGEGAGYNRGVLVEGASVGAESLSIVGMGGHGAAGRNIGVFLPGGGRWFRPFNGSAISVHGTGGSSTDSAAVDNDGIVVRASVGYTTTFQTYFLAGDTVEFVGLGGTGGIGAHTGIEFSGFDEIRASELLSISGTGNVGVHFNNTSGGSSRLEFHGGSVGDIQVAGSGVSTGILVSGGPEFYSHDGDIIFDGTAERNGVLIDDHRHAPDAVFKTTGAGEIRLTGTTQRTTDDGSVGVGIETVEFDTSATATGRVHIVGHSDAAASLESPDVRIGNDVLTTTTPRITGETVDIGPSGDLLVEVRDNGPTNWHEAVEADRVRLGDGLNYPQLAITTSPSFEPVRTDEFVIIDNTGTQPLDGGFWWETSFGSYDSGGAIARRNGDDWVINYEGGDGNDLSIHKPLVVTTTADSGSGSLRDAIEFANANPRLDVIVFDLPVNAPQVIQLQSPLPSISDSLQIRGTYIASKDGVEEPFPVEIRGAGTTDEGQPPVHGIEVLDGGEISDIDVTLEGLVVRNFSGHGIYAHTGGSLTTDSVTSGANGGSGFYVGPGFGSIDLNQSRSGVTADGMSADSNAEYGIHIVRDDVLSDASEIAVNGTQASGNVLGGLLIDDQRTEAANGQVAYSIFYSAFGISTDRAYAIPNGNFGARITQTGDAPLPAEHHEIRQGTFAGNQGVGLWLDNSREFVLPPGFESNFGVGRSDSGDRIPVPNEIGLRLTNASSISGDTDFSGGGDDGSYGGYYEGVSGTISGAIIKHNSEIGLLIEADETVAGRRLDISEILVEDNARGIVTQLNDDYALGEGYQLNLHGETKGNESPGIEIIGNGENAVVNLLVDAEDNSGAGVRIETSSPRVNIHRRPELAAGAIRNNEGPGIRHTGSGENLRVYRQPAADFGSGTEDPDTYSPQIFVNQGLSIDLRSEGPSANTDSVSVHPVIESADLAEDGFLDITGTNGAAAGFFLQFYATSPKLDGRGNLQTPLGNYTQLSGATIPQDVLDVLPGAPARIFDQDFDPERFRFRIEVGPDFNRGLLTAVVVDPTLGQATSDFIGVSELAPMVPIGTQLTALPPVLDIGGSESIFADDLFERTVSFTDEDSSEFAITVDYGEGDGPQPIDFRPEDRSIFLEHEYQNVGDYLVSVLIIDDTAPIGQIDIESFTVTVENTPPDIRFNEFTLNKRVNEGETVDLAGFFDDLNIGDRHTITIDWGDGSTSEQGPLNFSDGDGSEQNVFDFSHVYVDDGASRADAHVYRVVANIVDEHGGVAASPVFLIEVDNVLPEAQAASFDDSATVLSTTIVEGSSVTFFASLTDVGLKDSHDVWVDWGDESPRERVSINEDTELRTFSATHTYLDNSPDGSPFEITWTVEDDDAPGQLVPGEPLYVTVENAAATVGTLELNQPSLREGLTAVLFIPFTDPGTEARTATVDWGNGEVTVHDIAPGAISATVSHRYLQELRNDSGDLLDYTINATVNDGVADSNTASIGVKITDAPITVGALTLSSSQVDEGDSVTVSGTFSSDSPTDTYTVEIDWGNGETTSAQVDNTAGTYTATYRYDDGADPDSEFLVSATVANGFTSQSRFAATTVEVSNVAPTVFLTPAAPTTDDEILLLADAFDPSDSDSANLTFDWAVNVPFTTRDGGRILVIDPDDIGGGFSGPSLISVVASVSVTDPDGVESDTASVAIIADITGENEVELAGASFAAGGDTVVVAGLDGDDVLDASGVSSSKSVILIGGSGDDLLFDGAGDDIILLADGNDS